MQFVPFENVGCVNINLPIPNSGSPGQQVQFNDYPYLREKKILAIVPSQQAFDPNSSKANFWFAWASTFRSNPAFLTLYDTSGVQFVQNMPVIDLFVSNYIDSTNLSNNFAHNMDGVLTFDPRVVVWTKSFLWFPAGVGVSNRNAIFNVFYTK